MSKLASTQVRPDASRLGRAIVLNLLVAVAYPLTGVLAKLLAIPPGVVAPVWPSAGIALVALLRGGPGLLPGVFLGAFLVNAGGIDFSDRGAFISSATIATGIGLGGLSCALLGAWLIRRIVGVRLALQEARDTVLFLALGGPVACVASATIGVGTLWLLNIIPSVNVPYNWFTWWVGDSVGVVVVAPLLMVWFGEPRAVWRARKKRVAVPLAIALTVSVAAFTLSRSLERDRIDQSFQEECKHVVWALEDSAEFYLEMVQSVERLVASSDFVEPEEFRTFVEPRIADADGIQAIEWIPRVEGTRRELFESGKTSGPAGLIRERTEEGLTRAGERAEYYPVGYVVPLQGNEQAIGFDLGSEPVRRETLELARDRGLAVGSAPVRLVQDAGDQAGILIFYPHYKTEEIPDDVESRRQLLSGFALCVLRAEDFVDAALARFSEGMVQLAITDRETAESILTRAPNGSGYSPSDMEQVFPFDSLGRSWELRFSPTQEFLVANRPLYSWGVIIGCLLFTVLLGGFLLTLDGHIALVEQRVRERTEQLTSVVEELREARVASEEANQVKSRFIASMSHEIRTPLTAILGFGENLLEQDLTEEERAEAVDSILANGKHLHELLNDILDLSKIEAGKLTLEVVDVDVVQLVRRTGSLIESKLREKAIELQIEFLNRMPRSVATDPTRLQQILINLLGNAIKFSPRQSTVLLTVALSKSAAEAEQHHGLDFCVFDSGIGMSSEQVSRLFQPFTQADDTMTRRFGGTGLGLAITKELCEGLGGEVAVSSAEGRGSAFRVTIPVGTVDESDLIDPDTPQPESHREKTSAPAQAPLECRVLLAEDGEDNQRLIRFILERAGAEVSIANNGRLALDALKQAQREGERFDVLLTDVQMPEMDGIQLARAVRAEGYTIPIIALTANAMEGDRDQCLEAGCSDYSPKPIQREALLASIRAQLQETQIIG